MFRKVKKLLLMLTAVTATACVFFALSLTPAVNYRDAIIYMLQKLEASVSSSSVVTAAESDFGQAITQLHRKSVKASQYETRRAPSPCPTRRRPHPTTIRYRHDTWQLNVDDGDYEVVVYSAFYDDRPVLGDSRWLRALGVITVVSGQEHDRNLFCHVWYRFDKPATDDDDEDDWNLYVGEAESMVTGRDHYISGERVYGQRQFSCQLPGENSADSWAVIELSIAVGDKCANSSILLPVTRPTRPKDVLGVSDVSPTAKWQHGFVVCVESSFGSFKPEVVAEWIESYRLFGVTMFNVYDGNLTSSETRRVFQYYADRGLVKFRHLPPSVDDDSSEEAVRLSSPTSLNDCMLRHMYTARFLVVVDVDEIIVPHRHSNYTAMLKMVDETLGLPANASYHTYTFRNAYFFRYFSVDKSQPAWLMTARLRNRAPPNDYLFGGKSFVNPRRCLSVFNHYCWIMFHNSGSGLPEFGTSVDVPASEGLNHHYREVCPRVQGVDCEDLEKNSVVDDTMLQYRDILKSRVAQTLKDLGIEPPT